MPCPRLFVLASNVIRMSSFWGIAGKKNKVYLSGISPLWVPQPSARPEVVVFEPLLFYGDTRTTADTLYQEFAWHLLAPQVVGGAYVTRASQALGLGFSHDLAF